ncbi:MAG: CarD family transcriptional regulator [Lachnospiraceae bacterium]|nr:CarD family transcriptional regulator [Lachnospiraceae bacterium]
MFEKGEYLVAGNKGVCLVDDVTTLNISGVNKEREYYILKPVYMPGSTVYVPVDTAEDSLRRVLTHEEADVLIHEIPEIPLLDTSNDKLLEQEYRDCLKTNNCEEWVRIIKTIYLRKQKRQAAGRKETAVDAKYFRMAEESLYGELAIALDIPKADVATYITSEMDKQAG